MVTEGSESGITETGFGVGWSIVEADVEVGCIETWAG